MLVAPSLSRQFLCEIVPNALSCRVRADNLIVVGARHEMYEVND